MGKGGMGKHVMGKNGFSINYGKMAWVRRMNIDGMGKGCMGKNGMNNDGMGDDYINWICEWRNTEKRRHEILTVGNVKLAW
jgi:hypothetical protein